MNRYRYRGWTFNDIEAVRLEYGPGKAKGIGRRLGRSAAAVRSVAKRLGLVRKRPTPAMKAGALYLNARGVSCKELGRWFGLNPQNVTEWRRAAGLRAIREGGLTCRT